MRVGRADFKPERSDLRSERADSGPERADLRPRIGGGGDMKRNWQKIALSGIIGQRPEWADLRLENTDLRPNSRKSVRWSAVLVPCLSSL